MCFCPFVSDGEGAFKKNVISKQLNMPEGHQRPRPKIKKQYQDEHLGDIIYQEELLIFLAFPFYVNLN